MSRKICKYGDMKVTKKHKGKSKTLKLATKRK